MRPEETGAVMDVLAAAYPRFYAGVTGPHKKRIISLWASMFEEEPLNLVLAAVKALIAMDEKGFPPHIGAVKAKIRRLSMPELMTEVEAWQLVSKALNRSAHNAKVEYDKLPEMIQRMVGSPNQLREWALMDRDTVQSVVASNFQRSYRARAKHEMEYQAIPADVKAVIASVAGQLAIEGRDSPLLEKSKLPKEGSGET